MTTDIPILVGKSQYAFQSFLNESVSQISKTDMERLRHRGVRVVNRAAPVEMGSAVFCERLDMLFVVNREEEEVGYAVEELLAMLQARGNGTRGYLIVTRLPEQFGGIFSRNTHAMTGMLGSLIGHHNIVPLFMPDVQCAFDVIVKSVVKKACDSIPPQRMENRGQAEDA